MNCSSLSACVAFVFATAILPALAQTTDKRGKPPEEKAIQTRAHAADLIVIPLARQGKIRRQLNEEVGNEIKKVPGVEHVEGVLLDLVQFENLRAAQVFGLETESMSQFSIMQGRKLTRDDKRKIALGSLLARNLDKKIGDKIDYVGEDFEIVGIYESYDLRENHGAVIPLGEMQSLLHRPKVVSEFRVVLQEPYKKAEKIGTLRTQIEALRDPRGDSYLLGVHINRDYRK